MSEIKLQIGCMQGKCLTQCILWPSTSFLHSEPAHRESLMAHPGLDRQYICLPQVPTRRWHGQYRFEGHCTPPNPLALGPLLIHLRLDWLMCTPFTSF